MASSNSRSPLSRPTSKNVVSASAMIVAAGWVARGCTAGGANLRAREGSGQWQRAGDAGGARDGDHEAQRCEQHAEQVHWVAAMGKACFRSACGRVAHLCTTRTILASESTDASTRVDRECLKLRLALPQTASEILHGPHFAARSTARSGLPSRRSVRNKVRFQRAARRVAHPQPATQQHQQPATHPQPATTPATQQRCSAARAPRACCPSCRRAGSSSTTSRRSSRRCTASRAARARTRRCSSRCRRRRSARARRSS